MKPVKYLLLFCLLTSAAWAQVPTAPPVTYILDYGGNHLGNEAWLKDTIAARPQLLHLGKDVVMTHNWGPIKALGGENQAFGKGDSVTRLTVAETRQRQADLSAMVKRLHDGGVGLVMPYICAMTIGGDPDKRTGFWEFYDHWDEYAAALKLGPKPGDPRTWLQVEPDGKPHFFYGLTDGKYPPYEPNIRFAVCVNNPNWRFWSENVVRLCAEVGYDGVFVDNAGSEHCYCRYCQDGFATWLDQRYDPARRQELLGHSDVARLRLYEPKAAGTTPQEVLRSLESHRFWADSLRQHHLALKAAGEKVRKPFYVFPNGGESRPDHVKLIYPPIDYLMFEKSIGEFGTNPGVAGKKIVAQIRRLSVNNNLYESKLVQSVGGNCKPIMLTRGGYPGERPEWLMNIPSAELGMAETAAFGNGGGFLVRSQYGNFAEALRKWADFHERLAPVFAGNLSRANVAVACFPEQRLYGNSTHIQRVRALTPLLANNHLLFDYVLEEGFTAQRLKGYDLVIVPDVRFMSRAQLTALEEYLKGNGTVVLIGENAVNDEFARPYAQSPLPAASARCVYLSAMPNDGGVTELLGKLDLQRLALAPRDEARNVWLNAFARPDGSKLFLHVVNYNVELGSKAPEPQPIAGLKVKLPVPAGKQIGDVQVHDPDQAQPAPATVTAGGMLALPPLRIYQIVEITLK